MVSTNAKSNHKWPFMDFEAFMDTLKTFSDMAMLGIPRLSMKNVAHQWKLEVNIFIISKVVSKKPKIALFWSFPDNFQCKIRKNFKKLFTWQFPSKTLHSFFIVLFDETTNYASRSGFEMEKVYFWNRLLSTCNVNV